MRDSPVVAESLARNYDERVCDFTFLYFVSRTLANPCSSFADLLRSSSSTSFLTFLSSSCSRPARGGGGARSQVEEEEEEEEGSSKELAKVNLGRGLEDEGGREEELHIQHRGGEDGKSLFALFRLLILFAPPPFSLPPPFPPRGGSGSQVNLNLLFPSGAEGRKLV